MKLSDLNTETLKSISNSELSSLHSKCHQLYQLAKHKNNISLMKQIKQKYNMIVNEMIRRKIKHTSILEGVASKIVLTPFRIKRIYGIIDELKDKKMRLLQLKQQILKSPNEKTKMTVAKINIQLNKLDIRLKNFRQELKGVKITPK